MKFIVFQNSSVNKTEDISCILEGNLYNAIIFYIMVNIKLEIPQDNVDFVKRNGREI